VPVQGIDGNGDNRVHATAVQVPNHGPGVLGQNPR
jgi:hypothetical protein